MPNLQIFLLAVIITFILKISGGSAFTNLTDDSLKSIADSSAAFNINDGEILAPILRTRVPGTPSHEDVLSHISDYFRINLPKWNLSFQNSSQKTPISGQGFTPFSNLIVTRDPPWAEPGEVSRLLIVAHYDSKFSPEGFIGATDSAAPCGMMMATAKNIDAAMTSHWDSLAAQNAEDQEALGLSQEKGIMLLFLDGEEAFHRWTHEDSVYGAKSLAEHWESSPHEALSTFRNPIESIELFMLIDLLGDKNPRIPSYFMTTHWAYRNMATLESRMRDLGIFKSKGKPWFWEPDKDFTHWIPLDGLEDDHIPFMHRGVEIFHIIPAPFPRVWHQMDDDGAHLHMDTVEDWTKLITAFAAEWLELEGHMTPKASTKKRVPQAHRGSVLRDREL